MSSSFLEFLLKSGRVPADRLARAQLEQLRRLPAPADVALEKGWLTPHQVLAALLRQQTEALTFVQACEREGYWGPDQDSGLQNFYAGLRIPLAEILRADSSLNAAEIDTAWAEYSGQPLAAPSAPARAPLSGAAPQSRAGDVFLDEALEQAWQITSVLSSDPAKEGRRLADAFHRLQGILRLVGADHEGACVAAEDFLRAYSAAPAEVPPNQVADQARSLLQQLAGGEDSATAQKAFADWLQKINHGKTKSGPSARESA